MPREPIYGFHDYETYGDYLERLQDASLNDYTPESKAAALMTTVMLMQHGNRNKVIRKDTFKAAKKALIGSPVFKKMVKDPEALEMIRNNNADGLFRKLNEMTLQRQQELDRKYKRPTDRQVVAQDAELLKKSIESLKKSAGNATATGSPELELRGFYYKEMIKQLEYAQSLTEKGIQLSGEQTKNLIRAVKAYNDGGVSRVKPGGTMQAEGFAESMTLLKTYMPAGEFNRYCKRMNTSRGVQSPGNMNYVEPEAFGPERITAGAKTAKELAARNREEIRNSFTLDTAAEALAIRQLSGGNPNKLITPAELDAQKSRLKKPGTAFMKLMSDDRAREELRHLADMGEAEEVVSDISKGVEKVEDRMEKELRERSRKKVIRTAQGEINRSIRRLTGDTPLNRHFTEQYLANILASEQLAVHARGDEVITNGAFKERAEELQKDPAFQRLAQRYMENPAFRENMNRGLLADRSALSLANAYALEKQPMQARRDREQDQPQAQDQLQAQDQPPEQLRQPEHVQQQVL